jgi:hypothetical protein
MFRKALLKDLDRSFNSFSSSQVQITEQRDLTADVNRGR